MSRLKLEVRQAALDEAEAIRSWYEEQQAGLGERFTNALNECFNELRHQPYLQVRKEPFRYASISGFRSYRVVYAIDGDTITVYQIRHTSRRPHPTYGP